MGILLKIQAVIQLIRGRAGDLAFLRSSQATRESWTTLRSNKDLEKNPNFLPKSTSSGPFPEIFRSLQPLLFSPCAVATLAFVLFLEQAELFLPQGICT